MSLKSTQSLKRTRKAAHTSLFRLYGLLETLRIVSDMYTISGGYTTTKQDESFTERFRKS